MKIDIGEVFSIQFFYFFLQSFPLHYLVIAHLKDFYSRSFKSIFHHNSTTATFLTNCIINHMAFPSHLYFFIFFIFCCHTLDFVYTHHIVMDKVLIFCRCVYNIYIYGFEVISHVMWTGTTRGREKGKS